jgi:hypothetical protein
MPTDRPALETEVEVTTAMIEAGAEEIGCRYMAIRDAKSGAAMEAAEAVYRAMRDIRRARRP